jgi:two-component system cell cycle sensor histidine kinase/response regulator CckA
MRDKIKCNQFFNCKAMDCPGYDTNRKYCWLIDGTHCHDKVQDNFLAKAEICLECAVFKHNMDREAMEVSCAKLARQFSEARKVIDERERKLESVNTEMAVGLSEVFDALKKIAAGDPQVRIDETSSFELITKLKKMVNQTAVNIGELVDMTHEFAMGLAEHFDVLQRVSQGELEARVKGESEIEFLEALKSATNRMIQSVKEEIDHRRRVTRDLRVSEERFRTLAENAPIGITIINPDRTFAFINRTFTEIFGYTINDIPDQATWFANAYPERADRERAEALWKSDREITPGVDEGKPVTLKVCCKNGLEKTISFRRAVMDNGNHFVTYADITERARAQEVLKESEEKYRTLIENIQDGVILIEKKRFLFVNEAMARITGYCVAELIGMDIGKLIAPEDVDRVLERYRRRQAGEDVPRNYECCMLHKDGKTRLYVNIHVGVINYRDRVVTIGTVKDITQRKRAEQERREMAQRLRRSKQMEAIGTLAGGVAHDLNNILSGIVSYPELLLLDLPADSPLQGPIATIQKSGERAAAIVQDLLTLARRGVATMVAIDLNQTVCEYLKSPEFAKLCTFHPLVTVDRQLADDLDPICGSPVHILKSVMNLVSNAAEAMPDGGKVTIRTQNRYVESAFKGYDDVIAGEYVVLEVADTGVGISSRDIDQIFEPFYTKKVMGRSGTGLGMAVVWGTVKDHKGHIDVHSVEGEGTTFTLYFPISRLHAAAADEAFPVEALMGNGQRILVVDDVPEQRDIARAILKRMDYQVFTASGGEAAVDVIKRHHVDLLILDMIMDPGIDGLETYRRIAAFKPGQKAIIASGFSETERVGALQHLGVREYLKKPYSLEKIGRAVKRALEN